MKLREVLILLFYADCETAPAGTHIKFCNKCCHTGTQAYRAVYKLQSSSDYMEM